MPALRDDIDPDGLLEYSVVFSDRSLNSMSAAFGDVMRDISRIMRNAYGAASVAVVPGGGTYGMEAIARQFANDAGVMVIRNGWFSYRWSQILDAGRLASHTTVLEARQLEDSVDAPFAPRPLDEILGRIRDEKPDIVFCPHVETSAGMMVPDDFISAVAACVHEHGGMFVLDCVASGTVFVNLQDTGVDVLLTAPQKGWSASPCAALVMMSPHARARLDETTSSSFANDLKKWTQIMETYEGGAHAYHATMPTDALRHFRDALLEAEGFGLEALKQAQIRLGEQVRGLMDRYSYKSVAADGFKAPSVVVCFAPSAEMKSGKAFAEQGLQIAAGVPLECGERADYASFRIGLFGLDKLMDIDRTVTNLEVALEKIRGQNEPA
ncbi:MAG: alanine--glyoxylate aminotransferase family protein [Pseudomonadota bacterium]|nr:alanine--glyoxylate aminotransferase family protein [Pseudomonadota bacterium]MEC8673384.1 alanine--glyoxylate aminotransferase family protein [Pseudomonadota bacterium]